MLEPARGADGATCLLATSYSSSRLCVRSPHLKPWCLARARTAHLRVRGDFRAKKKCILAVCTPHLFISHNYTAISDTLCPLCAAAGFALLGYSGYRSLEKERPGARACVSCRGRQVDFLPSPQIRGLSPYREPRVSPAKVGLSRVRCVAPWPCTAEPSKPLRTA